MRKAKLENLIMLGLSFTAGYAACVIHRRYLEKKASEQKSVEDYNRNLRYYR